MTLFVCLAKGVLWISLFVPLYTYALYPALLLTLAAWRQLRADIRQANTQIQRRAGDLQELDLPSVAVLVAAHNEERHIVARLQNLLACDYPSERLRIYIGSDGSSDATNALVQANANERLVFMPFNQRRGKPSVINDLAASSREDILVFTDANTVFDPDAIKALVRHFVDAKVGCVSGELRLVAAGGSDNQDHVYWRYERMLKFFENRLGALLGANGGVYAVRRSQYQPIAADTIVDDFCIAAGMMLKGLQCRYDPQARASEETPPKLADEFPRRVRIGMGNYQALSRYAGLMNPRLGTIALAFWSHKVARWFVPHALVLALLANLALLSQGPTYVALALGQCLFYSAAAWGWWQGRHGATPKVLRIAVFFTSMNLALLVGHARYLKGGFAGTWARSAR